jgi:flagellar protein FliO/FliZ
MNVRHVIQVAGKAVFTACVTLASVRAADAPLFAAPAPGHPSGATTGGSIGQVTIALAVVLAFVFVAAWALRHLRKLNLAGNAQQLQVLAQVTLGAKERAVLIRVNDMQVLVGVAPGQVTALHTFPAPPAAQANPGEASVAANVGGAAAAATRVPSFQALLKKSLGMS